MHPDTVKAAIRALARSERELSTATIAAMLANGDIPGIKPYDGMPLRTLQQLVQEARRDAGPLHPDTDEALEMIQRDVLRVSQSAVAKLGSRLKRDPTDDKATRALSMHNGIIATIQRSRAEKGPGKGKPKDPARARGGAKGRKNAEASPASIFDRIAKAEKLGAEHDATTTNGAPRVHGGAPAREAHESAPTRSAPLTVSPQASR